MTVNVLFLGAQQTRDVGAQGHDALARTVHHKRHGLGRHILILHQTLQLSTRLCNHKHENSFCLWSSM